MNNFAIDLDLDKRHRGTTIIMRQGDKLGTVITATLYDHGTALNSTTLPSSNLTIYMVMRLPDDKHYYRKTSTYSNGVVTHEVDETSACSVAGRTEAYFEIRRSTTVIASTEPFSVVILPSGTDGMSEGRDYDDEIDAVIRQWLDDHPEATTTVEDDSLTTAKIKDGQITTAKLATDAVTIDKMANASVGTAELVDNSVTTPKLADGAVTTAKVADGSVTAAKFASGVFTVVTGSQIDGMFN